MINEDQGGDSDRKNFSSVKTEPTEELYSTEQKKTRRSRQERKKANKESVPDFIHQEPSAYLVPPANISAVTGSPLKNGVQIVPTPEKHRFLVLSPREPSPNKDKSPERIRGIDTPGHNPSLIRDSPASNKKLDIDPTITREMYVKQALSEKKSLSGKKKRGLDHSPKQKVVFHDIEPEIPPKNLSILYSQVVQV